MLILDTDIADLCAQLKAQGKKVVLTNGCFDILHVGHVRYLQQARALGDCLVVGLNSDDSVRRLKGATRPINSQRDRAEVLGALRCVDYVVIFEETTAQRLVAQVKPDIYAKGGDYQMKTLPEAAVVTAYGGEICFLPFFDGKSTSDIVAKMDVQAE